MNKVRVLFAVVGLISTFVAPWWMPIACIVLLSVRFRAWEAIVLGALIDVVWSSYALFWGLPLVTLTTIVLVWGLEPLRKELLVDQPAL